MIKKNTGRWKGFKNQGPDYYIDNYGKKKFFFKLPDPIEKQSFRTLSPEEIKTYQQELLKR